MAEETLAVGASPLARGSHHRGAAPPLRVRRIPAGAGEPSYTPACSSQPWAHPRWRGGARATAHPGEDLTGASPLARGSQAEILPDADRRRRIPAGAGEPKKALDKRNGDTAHPRWRGGATTWPAPKFVPSGASPLARGSPERHRVARVGVGRIPAGAGEPQTQQNTPVDVEGASPLARGSRPLAALRTGASPLARGSPRLRDDLAELLRRIPAGAGEPDSWSRAASR